MVKVLVLVFIDGNNVKKLSVEIPENSKVDVLVAKALEKLASAGFETDSLSISDLLFNDPDFGELVSVDHPFSEQKIECDKFELKLEKKKEVSRYEYHSLV
ncbi:hypothetical protein WR25_20234 isoform B [Diploscapter pachys]|uniref:Uncharacterized protein n=1 Tax=Diploscapter pachys TaxID=2018661 RepID=A0A2A2KKU8_9BILA|nr:hypothetical protein WR25_20234 isoform A [Diploscapter pachys]PAV74666.1 hypothetical protein WR25_20234 isoform B [Diploscapter pachys]